MDLNDSKEHQATSSGGAEDNPGKSIFGGFRLAGRSLENSLSTGTHTPAAVLGARTNFCMLRSLDTYLYRKMLNFF